jgi:hypothetical protein
LTCTDLVKQVLEELALLGLGLSQHLVLNVGSGLGVQVLEQTGNIIKLTKIHYYS